MLTPPREVNPGVSEDTSRAIVAAMALSMSRRLGDAAGFKQMLSVGVASVVPPVALPLAGPFPPTQPPVSPPTMPAGRPAGGGKRSTPVWGWFVGVAAVVVLGIWAANALSKRNGGEEPVGQPTAAATLLVAQGTDATATLVTATSTITASVTPSATPVGLVAVLAVGSGRWETDDESGALVANTPVPLPGGQRVKLVSESGVAQVRLPDGSQLFLEAGTEIGLTANATGTTIDLDRGRVLVRGGSTPVEVSSPYAHMALLGPGLLGLYLDPSSLLLEATCLIGDCEVMGTADDVPLRLAIGQASVVGVTNTAGAPDPANFDTYAALAPGLVPLPSATATITSTPTATPTIRPTVRAPTATPPPPATGPATPVPEATVTERPNAPGDPEPTDVPKPPATEPPAATTEPTPEPDG